MPKVLLIDDDLGTLEGYGGILRHAGFDVVTAASGRRGLALARGQAFDLVLADLRLPDQSGLEMLRTLRRVNVDVPVVVVTGFGSESTAADAFRLGADYVEKPLIDRGLLSVVDRRWRRRASVAACRPRCHLARTARLRRSDGRASSCRC